MVIEVDSGLLERIDDFINLMAETSGAEDTRLNIYHWREALQLAIELDKLREEFNAKTIHSNA